MAVGKTRAEILQMFRDEVDYLNERGWETRGCTTETGAPCPPLDPAPLLALLEPALEPSIRLRPEPRPLAEIPLGASRMGGLPDLPAGKRWPAWRTRHLAGCACCLRRKGEPFPARASFVCQIDCADVAALDPEGLLPDAGTLLLFSEGRWTAPPRNLGWKVLYAPPGAELVRRTRPPDDGYPVFRPCALTFEQDWTCPGPLALPLLNASLDDRQYELLSTFEQEDDHSRMLGQPAMVQGPDVDCRVQVAAERLGVQGLRCDRAGYAALSPSIRARLEAEAREWRLLFQIESEGAAGMNWIDGGRLYVFVRADDLAARRFDRCRFTMQTH